MFNLQSFWYLSRVVAGHIIVLFLFFKETSHPSFHNGSTSLDPHQHCAGVPFPWHTHQHSLLFSFLVVDILIGVTWHFSVILTAFP